MKNLLFLFLTALLGSSITSCIKKCHEPVPSGINNWQSISEVRAEDSLLEVDFSDASVGYISGVNGVIYKTSDGGKTFVSLTSGTIENLYSIHCINSQTAIAAGDGGVILRTTDGGVSWSSISSGTTNNLRNIYFYDKSNGFITGGLGTLLKTTDGGLNWTSINVGTTDGLYGICFTDINTGYVSGLNGTILKTLNGGNTWIAQTSGIGAGPIILNSIYFTDASHGTIVGGIGNPSFTPHPVILKTNDGGSTWTSVACPTTNEMYYKVKFADSSTGYIIGGYVAQNTGMILKTIDGGSTWTTVPNSSYRLTGLKIIDSGLGFAVGLNGTILKGI